MIDGNATLGQQFLDLAIGQAVAQALTDGADDDLGSEPPPLEQPWLPAQGCLSADLNTALQYDKIDSRPSIYHLASTASSRRPAL